MQQLPSVLFELPALLPLKFQFFWPLTRGGIHLGIEYVQKVVPKYSADTEKRMSYWRNEIRVIVLRAFVIAVF